MAEQPRVVLKQAPETYGLGVREQVAGPEGIGRLIADGSAALSRAGVVTAGPPAAVYHDPEYHPERIDVEVVFPTPAWMKAALTTPGGRVLEPRRLPGGEVAAVVHAGPYATIGEAYAILESWMGEYGYRASGPPCEVYLSLPTDPGPLLTEVRLPVERAGG